ncbi:MAG: hypothetical protein ISS26_03480 [Candidatus Omnitrophica bacterium]|nr:hypothetical protein [Candidatus Omnitrophota bacterium]
MNKKIYFEWHQPDKYVQFIQSSGSSPTILSKLIKKLFGNKVIKAFVQINELGIHSSWGGMENNIKFDDIHYVDFTFDIINNKIKVMHIYYLEDKRTEIPDKYTYGISDDVNIKELKEFFQKRGIKIEDRINV